MPAGQQAERIGADRQQPDMADRKLAGEATSRLSVAISTQ